MKNLNLINNILLLKGIKNVKSIAAEDGSGSSFIVTNQNNKRSFLIVSGFDVITFNSID